MLVLLIWLYNCYTPEWCVPLRVNERGSCFHSLDKLGFGGTSEPAADGLIRHGLRRATFPRGEGYDATVSWLLFVEKLSQQQLVGEKKKGGSVFDKLGFVEMYDR